MGDRILLASLPSFSSSPQTFCRASRMSRVHWPTLLQAPVRRDRKRPAARKQDAAHITDALKAFRGLDGKVKKLAHSLAHRNVLDWHPLTRVLTTARRLTSQEITGILTFRKSLEHFSTKRSREKRGKEERSRQERQNVSESLD